ncbi:MAG: hypothetical protein DVB31_08325, partial [Verrucomicrobia bacterium]
MRPASPGDIRSTPPSRRASDRPPGQFGHIQDPGVSPRSHFGMRVPTTRFPRFLAFAAILFAHVSAFAQAPGSIDVPFAPTGFSGGGVVGPYPGGKVVVSGQSLYQSAAPVGVRPAIQLLDNGTIDPTFNLTTGAGDVTGHVVTADGHLMLYGRFSSFGDFATQYVVRLNDDASTDTSFKFFASPSLEASAVLPLANGGAFVAIGQGLIYRVGPDGTKDPAFVADPSVSTLQLAIALQSSGKLLVVQNGSIFRLDAAGKRDNTYAETTFPNVVADQNHVVAAPDGSLYVASDTRAVNGGALRTLVRLLPEGGVDPAFKFAYDGTSTGSRRVAAMVLQPDGRLVLQGISMPQQSLFRVLANGDFDPTFVNNATVSFLGIDSESRILASGSYLQFSPTVVFRNGLYRLLNNGVPAKPTITGPPSPLAVKAGKPATFIVTAVGAPTLSYRWQFNEQDIPTGTDRVFTIPAAANKDNGNYRVIVSNPNDSATSAPVALTVISKPSVDKDPVGFAALENTAGSLVAEVSGEAPLAFQWYHDGNPGPVTPSPTLAFPSLGASDAGSWQLVANNAFGAATSTIAKVTVFVVRPQWLVLTNGTLANVFSNADNPFRPDTALRIVADPPRGPVLLYDRGVERWNDAGQRLWSVRYVEPDFGRLGSIAVDPSGNIYVAGLLHYTATLGDMGMTNNSAVAGPNGHKQAFVAKLDPDGHGLWYRLYEAAGPAIGSIAVAADGDVVFAGNNGGKQGRSYLGTLSVFEDDYMAAVAGKIGPDGTPRWLKSFPQFTFNRSTCEADTIVADAGGLYLGGLISSSIQFGTLQLQGNGGWIGKLGNGGDAVWIKATGGTAGQGDPLAVRNGQLWRLFPRDRTLQRWTTDGVFQNSFNAAGSTAGDSALLRDIGINAAGELLLLGTGVGSTRVGATMLDPGIGRKLVWMGRWATNGDFVSGRILATTTNANPSSSTDSVGLSSYTVAANGDLYAAGPFYNAFRLLGVNHTAPPKGYNADFSLAASWLAKQSAASLLAPEITQHPIAAYSMQTGDAVRIGIKATGPGPITYQWRHNTVPVPGETSDFHQFSDVTVADAGAWDCVATNPYGSATSDASAITVAPPFVIRTQPSSQVILLNGAVLA